MSDKDPLLDKLDRVTESIKRNKTDMQQRWDQSNLGKMQKDLNILQRFIRSTFTAATWINTCIIQPTWKYTIWKPAKYLAWQYVKLWNYTVYVKDIYGMPQLSKMRAVTMMIATACVVYILPGTLDLAVDAAVLYPLTSKTHTVYMNGQQKISDNPDVYEAGGCDDHAHCSDADTSTYRIRSTPFNQLWSMVKYAEWADPINLFYPDYVARAIPQQSSLCTVHTYGWRQKLIGRSMYRTWDMYSDILKVYKCEPIQDQAPR
jgi:hypothetical protein